jgi:hypothetical protein
VASHLANLYLVYYTQYSNQNNNGAHVAQGKEDGKKNVPGTDATELGFYEQGILNRAAADVQQFRSAADQELQTLESDLRTKQGTLDAELATRRQGLTSDQQTETQLLNQSAGKSSPGYKHLDSNRIESGASLKRISIDVDGRPLHTNFVSFYFPLLAVLTLLEMPINQQAFAFFFEHQSGIAYLIALAVGIFFVFFAHLAGWMVRTTGKDPGQNNPPGPYIVVAGLLTFVLILMYFLALVRAAFLRYYSDSDAVLLGDLGILDVATKATDDFTAVFSDEGALIFLLLNIAIFLVGAFVSYFRHDPHRDYEKVKKENEDAVEKITKMLDEYNTKSLAIIENYRSKMSNLNETLKGKEAEVDSLHNDIDLLKTNVRNEFQLVRGVVGQEISAYQSANSSSRTTDDPQYFGAATAQTQILNAIADN